MKDLVKKMLLGTPLEPVARRALRTIKPRGALSYGEDKNSDYDLQTIEVMKRVLNVDSNCIDAGCHLGSMLEPMIRHAPFGKHFAFEPIPQMYRELQKSFGTCPNVYLFNCALTNKTGTASFRHVVSNPTFSGLRKRSYVRPDEEIRRIVVRTDRLDNAVPGDIKIHFIKVDVEGAEFLVFKGGLETIKRNKPVIVFEHGLGAADYYGTRPQHIYDLLVSQCGLRMFLMADWLENASKPPLTKRNFCEHYWHCLDYYFMALK